MAYSKKTWVNRQTEHPNRRTLTLVSTDTYDVARAEGLIVEEGDAFDADTMNDLESRISSGITGLQTDVATQIETEATERSKADTYLQDNIDAVANVYAATLLLDDWDALSDSSGYAYKQQAQIVAEESGKQPVTSDSVFLTPCYFTPTGVQATDESLSEALAIINAGYTTSGSGTVTVLAAEKPACDITVKWTIQA